MRAREGSGVKRSTLGPGAASLERGSTFKAERKPLERRTELGPGTPKDGKPRRSTLKQGNSFAASKAQREKVAGAVSIVSAQGPCDPCHLVPRSHGGCEHPDCVFPLTRLEHDAFDNGQLDVLPYLISHGLWFELGHAITAHHYDPIRLADRCTGDRYVPAPENSRILGATTP